MAQEGNTVHWVKLGMTATVFCESEIHTVIRMSGLKKMITMVRCVRLGLLDRVHDFQPA